MFNFFDTNKEKTDTTILPPKPPSWSGIDSFIVIAIIIMSVIGFMFADAATRGGLFAGYATTIGAVFVLYQFPNFKKFFMRFKRIFDASLLFLSFLLITSNFVFLTLTFAGFLFSGLTAILKYWEDKKQYKSDLLNYRIASEREKTKFYR